MNYKNEQLNRIAFPLGGMGAGMLPITGCGAFTQVSLRHTPNLEGDACQFSAICVKGEENKTLVLEGPVPPGLSYDSVLRWGGDYHGLPRFECCEFKSEFPFATLELSDDDFPLNVSLSAWSPFIPGNADDSSLPFAALEYTFENKTDEAVEATYSFNAKNLISLYHNAHADVARVEKRGNSLLFIQPPREGAEWEEGCFSATVLEDDCAVNPAWFRGEWFDAITLAWKDACSGEPVEKEAYPETEKPSPGGSLFVPIRLAPNEKKTVKVLFNWFVPKSDIGSQCATAAGIDSEQSAAGKLYQPWYSARFATFDALLVYSVENYNGLQEKSRAFATCLSSSTLPAEVLDAVSSNLAILKSPTVLRQHDGRLWGWEGSNETKGSCPGTCTHVWNYAQAVAHLFPGLERGLRETEFFEAQQANGSQHFRMNLPIGKMPEIENLPAADGQLGGIIKVYREWIICGDRSWLEKMWKPVKESMDFSIRRWDPEGSGLPEEPQHNTYDISFWGHNGMISSFYLGALKAIVNMGEALGEEVDAYREKFDAAYRLANETLFNGQYFIQNIKWEGLHATPETAQAHWCTYDAPEGKALMEAEGPKYQYGNGCLSDGLIGGWLAEVSGLGDVMDTEKITQHLKSVYQYNFRKTLRKHANPQRPHYALGNDGGLLLCSWPMKDEASLPFIYSNEVWTGIEYQVASHLIERGLVQEGLEIVRAARKRYDGSTRNPFDEMECGHFYARAMSSYALLQAMSGIRYDASTKTMILAPVRDGDCSFFFSTDSGWGTVGVKNGAPFCEVAEGNIQIEQWDYKINREKK